MLTDGLLADVRRLTAARAELARPRMHRHRVKWTGLVRVLLGEMDEFAGRGGAGLVLFANVAMQKAIMAHG